MSKKSAHESKTARAAAVIHEQAARERRRRLMIVGGVVAALVLVVVVGLVIQGQRDTTGQDSTAPAGASASYGLALGEDDAPHTVVIYEDFLCPACAELEGLVNAGLTDAVEAGRVKVEYRPIDILSRFGDYSQRSANAFAVVLDAAGPEVARSFHDELFVDQPSESGPFPEDSWLVEKAVEAGADQSAVQAGIEDLAFAQWVENATDAASRDGVSGTPTVMLDGEPVSGETMDELADTLLTNVG